MKEKTKRKVAIVTGASSGIGKSLSLALIKEGFIVYGAARRQDKMQELVKAGGISLPLDLSEEESIKTFISTVLSKEKDIDLLVNAAGYGEGGAVETVGCESIRRQFDVNFFGALELIQAVLPLMRKKREGCIVNISSMAGLFSSPYMASYHASKYALEALTDSLRQEVRKFNIRVILIEPGIIRTPWGGLAASSIVKNSPIADYKESVEKAYSFYLASYKIENKKESKKEKDDSKGKKEVSKVVKCIIRAVRARRPHARYKVGRYSHLFTFIKWILPDAAFDFLIKCVLC